MATIIPNSEVRLIKNVPFSNNYKNVIQFNDKTSQENYFKSLPNIVADNYKYVRNNGTIKVPYYRDEILEYNYLMFKNKAYGDKYFYAFITNISYINPNTSAISFELDVFQTWFMDVEFKPSYVEREHCRRWNSDGTPVINTIPEGLDYGSEYQVKGIEGVNEDGVDNTSVTIASTIVRWFVLVVALDSEIIVGEGSNRQWSDFGVYGNIVEEVGIFVAPIPVKLVGKDKVRYTQFKSDSYVAFQNIDGIGRILDAFRYGTLLAKKLVNCYITDDIPIDYTITYDQSGTLQVTSNDLALATLNTGGNDNISDFPNQIELMRIDQLRSKNYYKNKTNTPLSNKYNALKSGITESKLLMYPYSYNVLSDLQGNEFIIKNEYVSGSAINISTFANLGVTQKIAYIVNNYLGNGNRSLAPLLDNGIINNSGNRITTIDDYTAAYLQGNMNTIEQSINATKQQSALNNQIAQNTAQTNTAITDVKNAGALVNAGLDTFFSPLSSAIAGGTKLGLASGIESTGNLIKTGINSAVNSTVTHLENENMLENTRLRGELANQQAVAGAMAKVQDARNMADNVSLQGGNINFITGYGTKGCYIISKQITQEYIDLLQDYFGKYGYKVHKVKIPNIHTRENWNYIQTVGANIVGNIPQMFIDALEQLFNQGITIWHTTDVGNYNLSNNEI